MKKLSGLLAVSLVAVMMAPAAFADIASTEYVDKNMEVKANKKTSGEELKSNDEVGYPSVAAAFSIANIALGDQAVIKDQGTDNKNKALITNKNGSVETGQIKAGMIANGAVGTGNIVDKAVTTAKIADENVTTATIANLAVTTEKIADANVTEGKLATDSVTPLKVKEGLIKPGANVTVSRDKTTGVVTISSEDTKYTLPTATDKNLGGVKVDTAMSETSTNPVQNKVANAAIAVAQKTADKGVADAAAAQTTADNTASAVNNATTGLATKASKTYVDDELAKKQNTLKQGTNITIGTDGTISATYEYNDSALARRVTTLENTGVTKEKIDAIAKKQDKLVASGEKANIAGSNGVSVSIGTNGKITVAGNQKAIDAALAAKFVAPGTSVTSTDGTYTLTMKVADGKPTYAWESIGR